MHSHSGPGPGFKPQSHGKGNFPSQQHTTGFQQGHGSQMHVPGPGPHSHTSQQPQQQLQMVTHESLDRRLRDLKRREQQLDQTIKVAEDKSNKEVLEVTESVKALLSSNPLFQELSSSNSIRQQYHGYSGLTSPAASDSSASISSNVSKGSLRLSLPGSLGPGGVSGSPGSAEFGNKLLYAQSALQNMEEAQSAVNSTTKARDTLLAVKRIFDMVNQNSNHCQMAQGPGPGDGQSEQQQQVEFQNEYGLIQNPYLLLIKVDQVLDVYEGAQFNSISSIKTAIPQLDYQVVHYCRSNLTKIIIWFGAFLGGKIIQPIIISTIPSKFWTLLCRFPDYFVKIMQLLKITLDNKMDDMRNKLIQVQSESNLDIYSQYENELQNLCFSLKTHYNLKPKKGGNRLWTSIVQKQLQDVESLYPSESNDKSLIDKVANSLAKIEKQLRNTHGVITLDIANSYLREQRRKYRKNYRNQCIDTARQMILLNNRKYSSANNNSNSNRKLGNAFDLMLSIQELLQGPNFEADSGSDDIIMSPSLSSMSSKQTLLALEDIVYMYLLNRSTDSQLLRNGRDCTGFFCESNWLCDELSQMALVLGTKPDTRAVTIMNGESTENDVENSMNNFGPTLEQEQGFSSISTIEAVLPIRRVLLQLCIGLRETADNKFRQMLESFCDREIGERLNISIKDAKSLNEVSTALAEIQQHLKTLLIDLESGRRDFNEVVKEKIEELRNMTVTQKSTLISRFELALSESANRLQIVPNADSESNTNNYNTSSSLWTGEVKIYLCIRFVKIFGSFFGKFKSESLDALMIQTLVFLESLGLDESHLMLLRDSMQEDYQSTR